MGVYPNRANIVLLSPIGTTTYLDRLVPTIVGDQNVSVGFIQAGTTIVEPVLDLEILVGPIAAGTAILEPALDLEVLVDAPVAAGTAILAPAITKTISVDVGAIPAGTTVVAPDQVNQTVNVGAIAAGTAVIAPTTLGDQNVNAGPVATGTAILAPQVDQTVPVAPMVGGTAILAPPQVHQTVLVGTIPAATTIVEPVMDLELLVGAIAASTAILEPVLDLEILVDAIPAATTIVAPTVSADVLVLVAPIAAGTTILAPSLSQGQQVTVAALAAGTAVLAPDDVHQTVLVGTVAAGTAILSPQLDQTVNVGVVAAATAVPALDVFFDQTVAVGTMAAATSILAPSEVDAGGGDYGCIQYQVHSQFVAVVEDAIPIPVIYANEGETPPTDGSAFIEFMARHTGTENLGVGSRNRYRMHGRGEVMIYGEIHIGDTPARTIAKTVVEGFRHTRVNDVVYQAVAVRQGRESDGRYALRVEIPYYKDFVEPKNVGTVAATYLDPVTVGNIIRGRFDSVIAVPESLPTQYDNAPFDVPNADIWARCTVQEGGAFTVEGLPTYRTRDVGLMSIQLFAPITTGDRAQVILADTIAAAFRAVNVDGILFETPQVVTVGRSGDRWWQLNVNCPFTFDTV